MRKLYPELVFGGIASSAVTRAEIFYPGERTTSVSTDCLVSDSLLSSPFVDYMDAIRQWAPRDCVRLCRGHVSRLQGS